MGLLDDAKKMATEHSDKIDAGIDKAAELAKDKTGINDATIDKAADKASELLDKVDGDK